MRLRAAIALVAFAFGACASVRAQVVCPDQISDSLSGPQIRACLQELRATGKRNEEALKNIIEAQSKSALKQNQNRVEATYGYAFRFRGADLVNRRPPLNRLYFYATPDHDMQLSIYFATKRFPLNLKVDGKTIPGIFEDPVEKIVFERDPLQHESLTVYRVGGDEKDLKASKEQKRPAGLHYIEFIPAVGHSIAEDEEYEVSGVVIVSRKSH